MNFKYYPQPFMKMAESIKQHNQWDFLFFKNKNISISNNISESIILWKVFISQKDIVIPQKKFSIINEEERSGRGFLKAML